MTDLSRGARGRRGGRRPGWLLLTVLLVLAIAASSALVFTNRVELLKLAVILALWAAVAAAFVSVIYRRQSDADQAKVRDLKLVYDLQLDREISARREYELTVETHLRRELTSELRAQTADEVAALRAELAALRTNLEILFDADLAHRPAIETDRSRSEWVGGSEAEWSARSGRIQSSRVTAVRDDDTTRTAESPIIDVPEEPLGPPSAPPPRRRRRGDEGGDYRGSHRRPSEDSGRVTQARVQSAPAAPPQPVPPPRAEPVPPRRARQPVPKQMPSTPPLGSENGHAPAFRPAPVPPREPVAEAATSRTGPAEPALVPSRPPEAQPARRGRHTAAQPTGQAPAMQVPPSTEPAAPRDSTARHRSPDAEDDGPPTGAQSAAELLARLQVEPRAGGRRRRRED